MYLHTSFVGWHWQYLDTYIRMQINNMLPAMLEYFNFFMRALATGSVAHCTRDNLALGSAGMVINAKPFNEADISAEFRQIFLNSDRILTDFCSELNMISTVPRRLYLST